MPLYLTLTVIAGRDIWPKDKNGPSNPYCVIRLNTGSGTHKTNSIKNTVSPLWDETFNLGEITPKSILKLTCWDYDRFSSDDFQGQFCIPFSSLCNDGMKKRAWFGLLPMDTRDNEISGAIELELSISTKPAEKVSWTKFFEPTQKNHVEVKEENPNRVFGVELDVVMERQKKKHPELAIPKIASDLISLLVTEGAVEEGIFRIGGRVSEIEKLKEIFDNGRELRPPVNIHDAGGCFKKFLRELPTPLLTFELFDSIISSEIQFGGEDILDVIRDEIGKLPPVNYELLRNTVILVLVIARNSELTKMSPQNLVICLAPNLIWGREESCFFDMTVVNRTAQLFSTLVLQYDYIFNYRVDVNEQDKLSRSVIDDMKDEARRLFITYDTTGDEKLTENEFTVFYMDFMKITCSQLPSVSEIRGAIIDMDANKSGTIRLDEFTRWWEKKNCGNGCGQNIRDFVHYAGTTPPPLPPTRREPILVVAERKPQRAVITRPNCVSSFNVAIDPTLLPAVSPATILSVIKIAGKGQKTKIISDNGTSEMNRDTVPYQIRVKGEKKYSESNPPPLPKLRPVTKEEKKK